MRTVLFIFILAVLFAFSGPLAAEEVGSNGDGSVQITGELQQWHRVDLQLEAVASGVLARPNPFRHYRFEVFFKSPKGQTLRVPGYFAGDGNGGPVGTIWKAHLNATEIGKWRWTISFREGEHIAADLNPQAGRPVKPYDRIKGSFTIEASDKQGADFRAADKGLLTNQGHHYLTYGGSGKAFVYTAPGIPENILGYRGFVNTTVGIGHDFAVHKQHWNEGDPDWGMGKGRALIGVFNYIAERGGNGLYIMSNTLGGDGKDVFMNVDANQRDRYDIAKLRQWQIAVDHAQSRGLFLHWHLAEHERPNMNFFGESLSVERRLYMRMLIALFGHANGLKWNIMEETEWKKDQRSEQMAWLKAADPYNHPTTYQVGGAGIKFDTYKDHLGAKEIDAGSFQGHASRQEMFETIQYWRRSSAQAKWPWTVAWDEPQRIDNDNDDEENGYPMGRRDKMWPCLMAGGDGFMWYIQKDGGGHGFDQRIEDFTIMAKALEWSGHLRLFFDQLPLLQMSSTMDIVESSKGIDYALVQPGKVYAIYNDRAGEGMMLNLRKARGTFSVRWFDPREGGAFQVGSTETVRGGKVVNLGSAPHSIDQDWAVLVEKQ